MVFCRRVSQQGISVDVVGPFKINHISQVEVVSCLSCVGIPERILSRHLSRSCGRMAELMSLQGRLQVKSRSKSLRRV